MVYTFFEDRIGPWSFDYVLLFSEVPMVLGGEQYQDGVKMELVLTWY